MELWWMIFLFLVVFFLYIHVQNQYKTSEKLEIYEMDYISKNGLQEICDLKQPVLFQLDFPDSFYLDSYSILDIREFKKTAADSIFLQSESAMGLLDTDTKGVFFTERNSDMISPHIKSFQEIDTYLQPNYTVFTKYDLLMGSRKSHTPLRYHCDTQRFLVVSGEKIRVQMTPWKSRHFLNPVIDLVHHDFWSPLSFFDMPNDNVPCLDFMVFPGFILYIPPYWWYSIQFIDTTSKVKCITYSTPINLLANLKTHVMSYLQPFLGDKNEKISKEKKVNFLLEKENTDIVLEKQDQLQTVVQDTISHLKTSEVNT
jgi:hypothetical protein